MAVKRSQPFQIAQAGATLNQVLYWDGTKWLPGSLSALGAASIYTGSGTIGAGVSASTTTATLPTSTSAFKINYSAGTPALEVDNADQIVVSGPTGSGATLTARATDIFMVAGSNSFTVGTTNMAGQGRLILTGPGGSGSIDASALLDLDSVSKILYVPRLTTAQQTALGTANNGGALYNTTTNKFTFRQGGAWVALGDVPAGVGGIYGGSGTIAAACTSTLTANSFWNVAYAGAAGTAINTFSTTGAEGITLASVGSAKGALELTKTQAFMYAGAAGQGITITQQLTTINSNVVDIQKRLYTSGIRTPATFAVDQNDYDTQDDAIMRIETTVTNSVITGLNGGVNGRQLHLSNVGSSIIRLSNEGAGSAAANRIILVGVAFTSIIAGGSITLWYDGTSSRWRIKV